MLAGGSGPGGFNAVPSGNPTGTGSNINYVGKHAYMYSGVVAVPNSETKLLEASVAANQYIVAKLQIFNGAVGSNDDFVYKVKINDEVILQYSIGQTTTNLYTSDEPIELVIVGGSKLTITAENQAVSARDHTATLTGVVYA
jgi:hypothetical protein